MDHKNSAPLNGTVGFVLYVPISHAFLLYCSKRELKKKKTLRKNNRYVYHIPQ